MLIILCTQEAFEVTHSSSFEIQKILVISQKASKSFFATPLSAGSVSDSILKHDARF